MAELLIYYKDNWFDLITASKQATLNVDGKFNVRYTLGDIIDIKDDGHFAKWDNPNFRYVTITDVKKDKLLYLVSKFKSDYMLLKKRRYYLDCSLFLKEFDSKDVSNWHVKCEWATIEKYIFDKGKA